MEMIMQWLTFRQILHFVVDNCIPSISKMKQSFPITNCPLVSNQQNKQKQRNEEQQTLPTTMYQPTWPSLYMIQTVIQLYKFVFSSYPNVTSNSHRRSPVLNSKAVVPVVVG